MNRRRFVQATVGLFGAIRLTPAAAPMIPRRTMYARVHISADEIRRFESASLLEADYMKFGPWVGIPRTIVPGLPGQQIVVEQLSPLVWHYQPVDSLK